MNQDHPIEKTCLPWDKKNKDCIDVALAVLGGKRTMAILWHLRQQTLRFSELHRQVAATTAKMLTKQLRELERDGLVHREIFAQVPPRVEYSLTDMGRSVIPVLSLMDRWGKEHLIE